MVDQQDKNDAAHQAILQTLPFHFAFIKEKRLNAIVSHFGSLNAALNSPQSAWAETKLLTQKQQERLFSDDIPAQVEVALQWANQPTHHIIVQSSLAYPALLNAMDDSPILLYVMGQVDLLSDPQIAIVGSRNASRLGLSTARDFAKHLSSIGLTITSGLAAGIDAAAHEGGLQGQGQSIAIVGTGLDRVYPSENHELAKRLVNSGAMVSEYPLGTRPMAHHFPQRNRLISGMSTGVLVVEAALKSGSLITARTAMEQGREVFAVPGAINNPHAKGCHQLIRNGAKLVQSSDDILEEIAPLISFSLASLASRTHKKEQEHLGESQQNTEEKELGLMAYIDYEPISLEELAVLSKMPVSEIQSQLMMLELSGTLTALSAGRWQRS